MQVGTAIPVPVPGAKRNDPVQFVLDEFARRQGIPGASLSIIRNGQQTDYATGVRDLNSRQPLAAADRMNVGSLTRPFLATLAMQLYQDGRLNLDTKIGRWLPEAAGADSVTVRHLLNNTSGIPSFTEHPDYSWALVADRPFSKRGLLDLTRRAALEFQPGTDWDPSQTNGQYLAAILEQVTGQSIETAIRDRQLRPLGLDEVVVDDGRRTNGLTDPGRTPVTPYWRGWQGNGRLDSAAHLYGPGGAWRTAGWGTAGVIANAPELARWGRDVIEGSRLLGDRTRREMHAGALTQPPTDSKRLANGLGFFGGVPVVNGSFTSLWHDGYDLGYSAQVLSTPRKQLTMSMLANRGGVSRDDWNELVREVVRVAGI